jgi:hypothetical protein
MASAVMPYIWRCCHIVEWCWIPHLDVFVVRFDYRNTTLRIVCDVYSRCYGNAEDLYKWSKGIWKEIDYYLDAIWC